MKVSIVIPNFNGEGLLLKNLPNVLASGADEVIVIDDGSVDKSVQALQKEFPEVKVLINQKNLGFIPSVNRLFKEATGSVVVLLNSDVLVEKDFLKSLIPHFSNKQVFAVNCHEIGGGPASAFWRSGFFEFKQEAEKTSVQKSAWASGGSAAYRKEMWQELSGFDALFEPFYWEDIDLSYRALKLGYEILWEPKSKVHHEHETTIAKAFKKRFVRWVQERNQILFIWKNISEGKLLREHQIGLIKRLLTSGPGYIVPFFWAFSKSGQIKKNESQIRSDSEVINYAND